MSLKPIYQVAAELDTNREITVPRFNVVLPARSRSAEIEHLLAPINRDLNSAILGVNHATWERNRESLFKSYIDQETALRKGTGNPKFRPNATKDVQTYLFGSLNLTPTVTTATGQPSVGRQVLEHLVTQGHPVAGQILSAREARTRLSQIDAFRPFAKEGRVSSTWDSLGTPMGRYTSSNPNLQNRITEIRETIEPLDKDHLFLSVDLGQAEYVTFASLSRDAFLRSAFVEGEDLHLKTWDAIKTALPASRVSAIESSDGGGRKFGKTINFAILYGMEANTLHFQYGLSVDEANALKKAWSRRAPTAALYLKDYQKSAFSKGKTSTHFGRTRSFDPSQYDLSRRNGKELLKTIWHHHNAGTAAEILKSYQIAIADSLSAANLSTYVKPAIQMHDEIIYSVHRSVLDDTESLIRQTLSKPLKGAEDFAPFRIDLRTGPTWLSISK